MSFSIARTHPFASVAGSNTVLFVERLKDGSEIPAGRLALSDAGTAEEARMLLGNICDYLNGLPLLERFGVENRTMHFYGMPSGIVFRYHEHDATGMSQGIQRDAFVLTIEPHYREDLLRRLSVAAFSAIPESGTKIDQRGTVRTHSGAPSAKPGASYTPTN